MPFGFNEDKTKYKINRKRVVSVSANANETYKTVFCKFYSALMNELGYADLAAFLQAGKLIDGTIKILKKINGQYNWECYTFPINMFPSETSPYKPYIRLEYTNTENPSHNVPLCKYIFKIYSSTEFAAYKCTGYDASYTTITTNLIEDSGIYPQRDIYKIIATFEIIDIE